MTLISSELMSTTKQMRALKLFETDTLKVFICCSLPKLSPFEVYHLYDVGILDSRFPMSGVWSTFLFDKTYHT